MSQAYNKRFSYMLFLFALYFHAVIKDFILWLGLEKEKFWSQSVSATMAMHIPYTWHVVTGSEIQPPFQKHLTHHTNNKAVFS